MIHQIHQEIGPALFKLTEQYVQTARLYGFEFGQGNPLHRLAAFMLTLDTEKKIYVPDWETLCLSNYIHQNVRILRFSKF